MSAERVSITKQAPTPHRPPRPMQRQEGPHQQLKRDISSLSPHWFCQGALSSSAVVPVCPGPHHQLTDELPHLSTDTRPPPDHLLSSPPVSFNSSRPVVPIPQSLSGPLQHFCLCRLHTPSPPQSQCILVGPGFCCFCLCSQLAYAASPRLSKDPVNGWPTTGQHETPWVGLAWSVKSGEGVCACVNERTWGV